MRIAHVSRSAISGAPGNLSDAIEKYTDYNSVWLRRGADSNIEYEYQLNRADIIQWHNNVDMEIYPHVKHKKNFLLYHSPPDNDDIWMQYNNISEDITRMVIPHFHAGLKVYQDLVRARNVVDLSTWKFDKYRTNDVVNITYSPSSTEYGVWQRKGVSQHKTVFHRIKQHFGSRVNVDLIMNTSYYDCITRKARSDIVVDECVTPSYHLSSLEGLALGKPTVCWVDDRVQQILSECTGSDTQPFHSVYVGWLEDYLIDMIERGSDYLKREGVKAKKWFDTYWQPVDIVNEYIRIYQTL